MPGTNPTAGKNSARRLDPALRAIAVFLLLTSTFASSAWAVTRYKTLHRFKRSDGFPYAGLIFDHGGNLYGTTQRSGTNYYGKVFELAPNSDGTWKESVLHSFNRTDGSSPYAGLVFDSAGNLYGAAYDGAGGYGSVFELTPDGHGSWTESVLHTFIDDGVDGMYPFAGLIFDSAGNLYGTTGGGGAYGYGTVFELTPNGDGSWKESVLHSFGVGNDGETPEASLIFDSVGNLYGTTAIGGANAAGSVFELMPNGDGSWKESVLYSFKRDGTDGIFPFGCLIFDPLGNLYGTTERGGRPNSGTVFELTPNKDGSWTESVLHSFKSKGGGGGHPYAGLIFDSAGTLYGTTSGGSITYGTVFKLKPSASGGWTETVLHSFRDRPGAIPYCGLVFDQQGNLYGTTGGDGITTFGSVFEITP
jgi:uncharacterized repeat protein (TIGR03803 family)